MNNLIKTRENKSLTHGNPILPLNVYIADGEPIKGIDPSVLEDKGRIYYTWGKIE